MRGEERRRAYFRFFFPNFIDFPFIGARPRERRAAVLTDNDGNYANRAPGAAEKTGEEG